MENDQTNKELELDLELEDESDQDSETTDTTTEETVDYKAIAEERERELKKLKRQLYVKTSSKPLKPNLTNKESLPTELIEKVNKLDLIESKRQFGYEHGLSPEETDWIFQATGGKPSKEALEIPFIKHGLEGYRASKRVEANTPGSSARGSVFAGKNFTELSTDERANAFAEKMKQIRK